MNTQTGVISFLRHLILFFTVSLVAGQTRITYTLTVLTGLENCQGGSPCGIQPVVKLVNSLGLLASSFNGSAYVQMGASPSGFEPLYMGTCDYNGNCGTKVTGSRASTTFINGYASFKNLMIKTAGTGYTLRVVARDSTGYIVGGVYTPAFSVTVGPVFQTQFSVFLGTAIGGIPFSPNPTVAAVDRGGNIVESLNNRVVTAFIYLSPKGTEKLQPPDKISVMFLDGVAKFFGLYINEAGYPYQVGFNASFGENLYVPLLTTAAFSVSVGEASQLVLDSDYYISKSTPQAGEYFKVGPRLRILDAGGNVITTDSSSGVSVSIHKNAGQSVLTPTTSRFAVALEGKVSFNVLTLDKQARNYQLIFRLYLYNVGTSKFTLTDIFVLSEYFNVDFGPPRYLATVTQADQAYADGQPFSVQPKIKVMDYGYNTLLLDDSSVLNCDIVSSLSATSVGSVVVYTKDTSVRDSVMSLTVNLKNGSYGAGELVKISVNFHYEVFLSGTKTPYLELNMTTNSVLGPYAQIYGDTDEVLSLIFFYEVQEGDYAAQLDVLDSSSFIMNGTRIVDGNGNNVSVALPSYGFSRGGSTPTKIEIDTTKPAVSGIGTMTPSGEYGAGEVIYIYLNFTKPVQVVGLPYLPLSAVNSSSDNSSLASYSNSSTSYINPYSRNAYYNSTSEDGLTVYFRYQVLTGDMTTNNLTITSSAIQLPSDPTTTITRKAYYAVANANVSLEEYIALFSRKHQIIINTDPPKLDTTYGVRTSHADGLFYPGEYIYVYARFTRPVVAVGYSLSIYLAAGTSQIPINGIALLQGVLDDDKTLEFLYIVSESVNCTRLDIIDGGSAIFVGTGGDTYIKRKSTHPTQDADVNTTDVYYSGNSLRNTAKIALYGYTPTVSSVKVISHTHKVSGHPWDIYPDDYVIFRVRFTTRVVTTCEPIVIIDSGDYFREATYYGGNQTTDLEFIYQVAVGDSTDGFRFRYLPNALCLASGCPVFSTCRIMANSTVPYYDADLQMPIKSGSKKLGVEIAGGNFTLHPHLVDRNTSVQYVTSTLASGLYGPGTVIYIKVGFQDIVSIYKSSAGVFAYPKLYLNIGKYAEYVSGSATTVMTFMYQVEVGDVVNRLEPVDDPVMTNSAIRCTMNESCALVNAVNGYVNLTTYGKVSFPNISIDSNISYIMDVYTTKPTSPYDGFYTVGDVIDINVIFSRDVMVLGLTARLQMDVGYERYAYYQPDLSSGVNAVFQLVVESGDSSSNLTFLGRTIDMFYDTSAIYRKADIPTLVANITLPSNRYVGRNGSVIRIDTSVESRPVVQQVVAYSPNGTYRAGDEIIIRVDYSHYVQLTGYAKLYLNLGNRYGVANYVGYDDSNLNASTVKLPTNATKHLYFSYTVGFNDFIHDLEYVDTFSLNPGKTIENDYGRVYQYADNPQVICSTDLPAPGEPGSLSNTSNIYVDGTAGYLTSLQFATAPGLYSVGDEIDIMMNFSTPVVVTGTPYLLMDLGKFIRKAYYRAGSTTNQLTFRYKPVPGDQSDNLDYLGARLTLHSARDSFQLNGGTVLVYSTHPFVPVEILLSPTYGALSGTTAITAIDGQYTFLDLSINAFGLDYLLQFTSSPYTAHRTIRTTQTLFVSFSTETSTRPDGAQNNETIGWDVAVSGTLAAIGAPNTNKSVTSVQLFYSTGVQVFPTPEIQMFKTTVEPQPAIQRFYTTADVGASIGGYFKVSYDTHGPSTRIPHNADHYMLEAMIMGTIPELGNVTVTREPYIYCACDNAYNWTITFHDFIRGTIKLLEIDKSLLTGDGVTVVGPTRIQNPAYLSGGFYIKALGKTSSYIPFNAGSDAVQEAITAVGLQTYSVAESNLDSVGSRVWSVTFADYEESFEIPLLEIDTSKLKGGVTGAWVKVVRKGVHGSGGLSGRFRLEWRGNITDYLPYNATSSQVKAALEALPTIDTVHVQRSRPSFLREYKWTVEFVQTRTFTSRGYMVDSIRNLEPLVPHSELIGTNATILVEAVWSPGTDLLDHPYGPEREGTYGAYAGAVYIFSRASNGKWYETAKITGEDTNAYDKFGSSVALLGDVLLVGAVGADVSGEPEKQSIFCSASSGYFQIELRGWKSGRITHNASREDLIDAIVPYSTASMELLHPVYGVEVQEWGDGGLCDNNTAVITFYSPYNGDEEMFGVDTGPALELITIDGDNLEGYTVVKEVQKGTWRVNNADSNFQQIGGAYAFRTTNLCQANDTSCLPGTYWEQEAKFYPLKANGFDRFGWSVCLTDGKAIVGSPGSNYETGVVYVYKNYKYSNASVWVYSESFSGMDTVEGDNFGHSVAIWGTTLLVGAPYHAGRGAVYVFRSLGGKKYSSFQILVPTASTYALKTGDLYGFSIAIHNNLAVVGAPGRDEAAIYVGKTAQKVANDTGAVFVFQRRALNKDYTLLQRLTPTNVVENDRFGFDVAVNERVVLVGQVSKFEFPLGPSRAVMEIKTSAEYNKSPVKNTFRLTWRSTNSSGHFEAKHTRPIPTKTTAVELKAIIEADLNTGTVLVSRSAVDQYDGGYVWTVTFKAQKSTVEPFGVDYSDLGGTNARVDITVIHPSPLVVRSKAHVFQRFKDEFNSLFEEELFLSPYTRQPNDICGWSVALLSPYFAYVGCPNRDDTVPNHNAGAGIFFNISLLKLQFEKYDYNVTEGQNLTITVERDQYASDNQEDVLLYVQTLDRNADYITQTHVQGIYGIANTSREYVSTMLDTSGIVGKAVARTQYYGSTHNESVWVDGMYDYRAISDYVPFKKVAAFLRENTTMNYGLTTTPDIILETPNETVSAIIWSPGVWPSVLGRFYTSVVIVDDQDGYYEGPQYEKLYASRPQAEAQMGYSLAVNAYLQVMFTGSPHADMLDGSVLGCGAVVFYHFEPWDVTYDNGTATVNSGKWVEQQVFNSPNPQNDGMYGDEVAVGFVAHHNTSLLVVGEPNNNTVHVYSSIGSDVGASYSYEAALTTPDAYVPQHHFGGKGALAITNYLVAVGAPGLEAVYIFRRVYCNDSSGGYWNWTSGTALRSSEYDYDLIGGVVYRHQAAFGTSVGASDRTVAVGAPHADYDKLGTRLVEVNWDTEGTDIIGWGRGKAFVFDSSPEVQTLTIYSDSLLTAGSFILGFAWFGYNGTTPELTYETSASDMTAALLALSSIDVISVQYAQSELRDGTYTYTWSITFSDEWQDMPLFSVIWNGYGCPNCTAFDGTTSRGDANQVQVDRARPMSDFMESQALRASDAKNGNRFGWSVDIDGDQLVVSAIYSSAITMTTWDFECGCLVGWQSTGSAFDFQPTYGDNSYYRVVREVLKTTSLRSSGESSRPVGLYYIGTYEKRPGSGQDYLVPDPAYEQGNSQGDEPQGTLTSEVFMILGDRISFLLGGGCDYYAIYVELLVDGISVAKLTGQCEEQMKRVFFDTSLYRNRAAQIRIVDASSGFWGHINVDDFRFDWDVRGAVVNSTYVNKGKESTGGHVETPHCGVVYTFHRHQRNSKNFCGPDKAACEWTEETRLIASDKRPDMLFGAHVAVNDAAGIVIVSAPQAAITGYYKEYMSVYPYVDVDGKSNAMLFDFPVSSQNMSNFQSQPLYASNPSGAYGLWYMEQLRGIYADYRPYEQGGAVYIYTKVPAVVDSVGDVTVSQYWIPTEKAKLQAPDAFARDLFGYDIVLDGSTLVVGAPGQDGLLNNAGAVYLYNAIFASVSFSDVEFRVLEGYDSYAIVTIDRDLNIYSGKIALAYATSDLTAMGVDSDKFQACYALSPSVRGAALCGDYEQTSGIIVIDEGDDTGGFRVNIINDLCKEVFMKYIQVTLSVPGSAAIQGATLQAKIRIDDDDFLQDVCVGFV